MELIDPDRVKDPSRRSQFGGLDTCWTTDLKLNKMALFLKGQPMPTLQGLADNVTGAGIQWLTEAALICRVNSCFCRFPLLSLLFLCP